mmetsp:Transcript_14433/g.39451  ORF Transcript_14433/g.39451 Transcript_14433/m.39451 type:complete len:232 (-) Transcript_14433:191-886(-)|eukprot:CAMPEP_0194496200 /NCGR_PEP_ID=MMETSP0253-20130528/13555_1 /TAXON_ID=2966 /ORGANISM="Noctiluca scintillans" /LENGTH=231 /DNA_ID=CAMNT_0039337567 /DNA_START=72 /DNA_END=767 /DNA_ORIENTATION=-
MSRADVEIVWPLRGSHVSKPCTVSRSSKRRLHSEISELCNRLREINGVLGTWQECNAELSVGLQELWKFMPSRSDRDPCKEAPPASPEPSAEAVGRGLLHAPVCPFRAKDTAQQLGEAFPQHYKSEGCPFAYVPSVSILGELTEIAELRREFSPSRMWSRCSSLSPKRSTYSGVLSESDVQIPIGALPQSSRASRESDCSDEELELPSWLAGRFNKEDNDSSSALSDVSDT